MVFSKVLYRKIRCLRSSRMEDTKVKVEPIIAPVLALIKTLTQSTETHTSLEALAGAWKASSW